jgi:hypothetical protein
MSNLPGALDLSGLVRLLIDLSTTGCMERAPAELSCLVVSLGLGITAGEGLLGTTHLFALGTCRDEMSLLRRVTALLPDYRGHLLPLIQDALKSLPDDDTLGDTLERLDHLGPELLALLKAPAAAPPRPAEAWSRWDVEVWQAPDAVTLLAKVVAAPEDLPERPQGPNPAVPLDWWKWTKLPDHPAPAPWGDTQPLGTPLATARHPFWGALVATLDACTGDYPWQSLDVRADSIRSRHVRLGAPAEVLADLWRSELALYPAALLISPSPPTPLPSGARGEEGGGWFHFAVDHLARAKVAAEVAGSWRLHEDFRQNMLRDDDHMLAYEALRQRAYQLARAAEERASAMKKAVPA